MNSLNNLANSVYTEKTWRYKHVAYKHLDIYTYIATLFIYLDVYKHILKTRAYTNAYM